MPSDQGQNEPRFEPRLTAPATEVIDRRERPEPRPRRARLLTMAIALVALGAFAGVAWYATSKGQKNPGATVPVITAEREPIKERPAEPGGMDVPNRNIQVFNQITPDAQPQKVERLLPPAETPVARPAAEAAPKPPAGPLVPDAPAIAPRADAPKEAAPAAPVPSAPRVSEREIAAARVTTPKEPAAAPKATTKASAGAWRIQLGAVREEARAKAALARIEKANADILKGLSGEIARADLGAKGVYHRMRMGPLADKAAADSLCRKLVQRKIGCIVVKP